jgi:Regulator of polyketide synthase expression
MTSFIRLEEDNAIVRQMLKEYQSFQEIDTVLVFEDLELDLVTALLEERVLFVALMNAPLAMKPLMDGLPYGTYSVAKAVLWHYQRDSLDIALNVDDQELATVDSFLTHHQHIQETADDLFVHRNTLQYRLDRFYQKTGLQVRHFDDALSYYIIRHFCATCQ